MTEDGSGRSDRMVLDNEDELHQMNSELAGSLGVLQEMVDTVRLWKDKYDSVEAENDRLKGDKEYLAITPVSTPPTSMSRSYSVLIRSTESM